MLLQELRNEIKKAKLWISKYERSGFEQNMASNEVLDQLVAETKMINVNLDEYTDAIVQIRKTYCLCRNLYFGDMVGCDLCDEWYHFQCIGINNAQVEKCDKYICIRCLLKNSFITNTHLAANLTNKWMNSREHFQSRDNQYMKVMMVMMTMVVMMMVMMRMVVDDDGDDVDDDGDGDGDDEDGSDDDGDDKDGSDTDDEDGSYDDDEYSDVMNSSHIDHEEGCEGDEGSTEDAAVAPCQDRAHAWTQAGDHIIISSIIIIIIITGCYNESSGC